MTPADMDRMIALAAVERSGVWQHTARSWSSYLRQVGVTPRAYDLWHCKWNTTPQVLARIELEAQALLVSLSGTVGNDASSNGG